MLGHSQARAYKGELEKVIKKITDKELAKSQIDEELKKLKGRKKSIGEKLKKRKQKVSPVSDHARVRYLERIIGLNIPELDIDIKNQEKHLNRTSGGIVTTIIPRDGFDSKEGKE